MAMTNAERQKKFRQQRTNQITELETLRNENIALKSQIDSLLKQIDEITAVKPKNTATSPLDIDTWETSSIDPQLFDLDVPLFYHPVTNFNSDRDFTRMASDVWLLSRGKSHWKECYRIILTPKTSKKAAYFELHPPASSAITDPLFTASTWESVTSHISLMGL
jgi:hypothetical protein